MLGMYIDCQVVMEEDMSEGETCGFGCLWFELYNDYNSSYKIMSLYSKGTLN